MTLRKIIITLVAAPLLFTCGNANSLPKKPVVTDEVEEAVTPAPRPELAAASKSAREETRVQTGKPSDIPSAAPRKPIATTPVPITSEPPATPTPTAVEEEVSRPTSVVRVEEAPEEVDPVEEPMDDNPDLPAPPDHSAWNDILQQYVSSSGNVYYSRLKNTEAKLDAYLVTLAEATPDQSWSRNEAMAYWINAYNAYTVKRILDNWPVKSIMDLDGGKTWDVKWIKLGGNTYSLNEIEHEILRPKYGDARIHFAVNCAAASCPPLANKAFTAGNLNGMLDNLTRRFINNDRYNRIEVGDVKVSKIFDWYGGDFGNLRNYLNQYLKDPIPEHTEISFQEYDWSLNN
jgi:hypothetical protein